MLAACDHQVSLERHSCVVMRKQLNFFLLLVYRESCARLQRYLGGCKMREKEFDELTISFPLRRCASLIDEWHCGISRASGK